MMIWEAICLEKKYSSRDYLIQSALDLLSRKSIENICIKDITDNCGLSTRTFYNHFKDKFDLFLTVYTSQLERFLEESEEPVTFRPFVYYTGQLLWDHPDFYRNYHAYTGQNDFRNSVAPPLIACYEKIITDYFHDPIDAGIHEAVRFFVLGMIAYVDWSFQNPELEPLDKATNLFCACAPRSLEKYL